jgi:hypothetical protein
MPNSTLNYHTTLSNRKKEKEKRKEKGDCCDSFEGEGNKLQYRIKITRHFHIQ